MEDFILTFSCTIGLDSIESWLNPAFLIIFFTLLFAFAKSGVSLSLVLAIEPTNAIPAPAQKALLFQ